MKLAGLFVLAAAIFWLGPAQAESLPGLSAGTKACRERANYLIQVGRARDEGVPLEEARTRARAAQLAGDIEGQIGEIYRLPSGEVRQYATSAYMLCYQRALDEAAAKLKEKARAPDYSRF